MCTRYVQELLNDRCFLVAELKNVIFGFGKALGKETVVMSYMCGQRRREQFVDGKFISEFFIFFLF